MASTLKGYSNDIFSTSHGSQQVPKLAKVSGIGSTYFSNYLASSSMACRQENLLGLAWHKILEVGWGLNTTMSINEQVAGCWKTFSRVLKALGSKWNSYSHWRINYNFVSPSMHMATRMVSGVWFSTILSFWGVRPHIHNAYRFSKPLLPTDYLRERIEDHSIIEGCLSQQLVRTECLWL